MVDTQHFCLRWNNYQSSITSAFENLRDDEDFVDVTLACDGKSLKAHRVVLSACSPYFRELLKVSTDLSDARTTTTRLPSVPRETPAPKVQRVPPGVAKSKLEVERSVATLRFKYQAA